MRWIAANCWRKIHTQRQWSADNERQPLPSACGIVSLLAAEAGYGGDGGSYDFAPLVIIAVAASICGNSYCYHCATHIYLHTLNHLRPTCVYLLLHRLSPRCPAPTLFFVCVFAFMPATFVSLHNASIHKRTSPALATSLRHNTTWRHLTHPPPALYCIKLSALTLFALHWVQGFCG